MKTVPVIFVCLLILVAAPSGIWCREEMEYQPHTYWTWKRFMPLMDKLNVDILSTSEGEDGN
uniref:Venom peptide Ht213 n=1 Tax=Hadogenes troglodytes TaxID=1577150 RepID=A0A1B3IJ82_9SCOR|nr:venom peptide Ht213 [Hadogenes troglodytes]